MLGCRPELVANLLQEARVWAEAACTSVEDALAAIKLRTRA